MNIAVMGATGMLGMAFMRSSDHNYNIIPVSRKDFDFTDTIKLINFLDSEKPDVVINTAANIYLHGVQKKTLSLFIYQLITFTITEAIIHIRNVMRLFF